MTECANIKTSTIVRSDVAKAMTDLLEKTAKAIGAERLELQRKFPSMSALPPAVDVDPNAITDFTESEAYRRALEDYVAGRSEQNLLATVLHLLESVVPKLIGRF